MINTGLKTIILSLVLLGSTLSAGTSSYEPNTKSLVGLEGGYSSLDYESGVNLNNSQGDTGLANLGLKIGAETRDFRVFLSGRYFYDSSSRYDYLTTIGGEIQYKFNPSKAFNIFLGVNAGLANAKTRIEGESFSRTFSDFYVGGDLGTNIHLGKATDLELGARVMSIQSTNTKNDVSYRIGNIVNVYASLIFKWSMD
ncbi:hypothetical protein MNB_SM-4-955 [hydrothermal vent metagenome]|uniref:Outer membrane protein beta-barrel domain-containing protein n=1 Tax=hydrothermal vent metagenome TaxID=652676 RepID=A0A1W1C623_9ZZZZ